MAIPNPFDDAGLNNFRRSNIVVNFININYNHQQLLIHFPAQETRPAAAASSTFMIRHGIFAFTIPTAMSLVQMRYPNQNLFRTHPLLMMLMMCSVIAYSLAFILELLLLTVSGAPHDDERPRNWSLASGLVSLTFLLGLLFSPPSSWPWLPVLLCFLLVTLLAFAPKLGELLSRFGRGRNRLRRTSSPPLPLSTSIIWTCCEDQRQ
ncbi:hypothetical protein ACE6H2_007537 [Prunus campanulata]